MSAITERVAAGAAFLDEHDPEWWREIDLDALDMGDAGKCVLGQRCPLEVYDSGSLGDTRYIAMAKHLSGTIWGDDADKWAAARGFQVDFTDPDFTDPDFTDPDFTDPDDIEYANLAAEWRRVIEARRSA